jgi:hypothetical protein
MIYISDDVLKKWERYGGGNKASCYWLDRLPKDIAVKQTKWERSRMIMRARAVGLSMAKIGKYLGLSSQEISVICRKIAMSEQAGCDFHIRTWRIDPVSPIEKYFNEKLDYLRLSGKQK